MEDAIGGYFELELRNGEHYHKNCICLNTGRNCFEYILKIKKYSKVYIPYYMCDSILEPLVKCGVSYEFYHINEQLEPIKRFTLKSDEAFLYTNYFGVKQLQVEQLYIIYGNKLIVDNSQAFYAKPIDNVCTFYSPRKFFGVADGGYLYIDEKIDFELMQDMSFNKMSHLLKRKDNNAESGFCDFKKAETDLRNNPIKSMSKLTHSILSSIDYDSIKQQRLINFYLLHSSLKNKNKLDLDLSFDEIPMVYPFYTDNQTLREYLKNNKIYVATYWPNVLNLSPKDDLEYHLASKIIPLPIDHRYGSEQMKRMLKILNS